MMDSGKQSGSTDLVDIDIHEVPLRRLPSGWIIGLVVGLIIGSLAGTAKHVLQLEQEVVEALAIEDAAMYSTALQEFRTIYTSEVVEPARAQGTMITHNYLDTPGSLPLPATLSMLLGERMTDAAGGSVRLYSDFPFPWRTAAETKLDEFQLQALATLRTTPDKPVIKINEIDGQLVVRYATADHMREGCVQCHNTHPDSPKRDWKTGDVRGVIEVSRPVSGGTTAVRWNLQKTIRRLTGIAILALVGLAFVIIVLRRSALYSRQLATETAKVNHLLEREIEHRKEMEKQAIAVQKLESLGLLAGGIAHDFNNLLAGILGNAEMVQLEVSKPAPKTKTILRYTELILKTGEQTKRLVKQLLTYAGGHAFEKVSVNLSQRIEMLAPLLATASRHKANLVLETDPFLPVLMGDPVQLDQVVMNLLTNASDAIQTTGGTITIRTGVCTTEDQDPKQEKPPTTTKDNTVAIYLEVEDDGCGLDPEIQSRMFDPFYSTKGPGRGLGLSAIQGIVRDHDGTIMVASEVDSGTIIRVDFQGAIEAKHANTSSEITTSSPAAIRHILVVDDDTTVRELTTTMLAEQGFIPESASSGTKAIGRLKLNEPKIDAVILDVCMPEEDGLTIYKSLILERPNLPVMFMSGFAVDEGIHDLARSGRVNVLTKPFTLKELSDALQELQTRASKL